MTGIMYILILLSLPFATVTGQSTDGSAPPTTPVPCVDQLGNCQDYGATVCQNPLYAPWVMENCRYHCRQCSDDQLAIVDSKTTPPPCVDQINNCSRYGQVTCMNAKYKRWAQTNCRYFCRFCTQEQLLIADSKTTTTTTLATPLKPCADKIPHCDVYNDDVCTNEKYRSWAEENCPVYCMLCSTSGFVTIPPRK
uniref:Uncharacterized protein LOC111135278 isoform X6 n=1 Tax=Crassostrea virginica TaxID=6565 RepID=A0A8B8ELX7_CRAVI|nr:uncharacterized protein LOC111135278 isoform X6 [Crassostrea virginica]